MQIERKTVEVDGISASNLAYTLLTPGRKIVDICVDVLNVPRKTVMVEFTEQFWGRVSARWGMDRRLDAGRGLAPSWSWTGQLGSEPNEARFIDGGRNAVLSIHLSCRIAVQKEEIVR